jgi:hypothetical protein
MLSGGFRWMAAGFLGFRRRKFWFLSWGLSLSIHDPSIHDPSIHEGSLEEKL